METETTLKFYTFLPHKQQHNYGKILVLLNPFQYIVENARFIGQYAQSWVLKINEGNNLKNWCMVR